MSVYSVHREGCLPQCMLGYTQTHCEQVQLQAGTSHRMRNIGTPCGQVHPLRQVHPPIDGHCSGRYALYLLHACLLFKISSWWNLFLPKSHYFNRFVNVLHAISPWADLVIQTSKWPTVFLAPFLHGRLLHRIYEFDRTLPVLLPHQIPIRTKDHSQHATHSTEKSHLLHLEAKVIVQSLLCCFTCIFTLEWFASRGVFIKCERLGIAPFSVRTVTQIIILGSTHLTGMLSC